VPDVLGTGRPRASHETIRRIGGEWLIRGAAVGSIGRLEMEALPRQEYGKLS
jgi:hypothetical protein